MSPIIEARSLTKRFGETHAPAGLDLVAESGRVTALLGPNGAGKTTFISAVATLSFLFVSSANVPVSSMPGWMQPFAANQPITVFINAVRSLMQGGTQRVGIGHTTTYWVVLTLVWSVGITLVFGAITVRKFGRQI